MSGVGQTAPKHNVFNFFDINFPVPPDHTQQTRYSSKKFLRKFGFVSERSATCSVRHHSCPSEPRHIVLIQLFLQACMRAGRVVRISGVHCSCLPEVMAVEDPDSVPNAREQMRHKDLQSQAPERPHKEVKRNRGRCQYTCVTDCGRTRLVVLPR